MSKMHKGNNFKWLAVILLLAIFTFSYQFFNPTVRIYQIQGLTMGTSYSIKWLDNKNQQQAVQTKVDQLLVDLNQSMSTYIADSELSLLNINRSREWQLLSEDLAEVVALSLDISQKTSGAFDITLGPLVNLWGFGPKGRIEKAPNPAVIKQKLKEVGYQHLSFNQNTAQLKKHHAQLYLDLSAVAKGYAVDKVALLLEQLGLDNFLVEIGGELKARGVKLKQQPWRVAIERPYHQARSVHSIIKLTNQAIATSGDYRNYFEHQGQRFSHTIDPKTGYPVNHNLASVTVLSNRAAEADALATAFMVMGLNAAYAYAEQEKIHALFISHSSQGFVEKMTLGFNQFLQD